MYLTRILRNAESSDSRRRAFSRSTSMPPTWVRFLFHCQWAKPGLQEQRCIGALLEAAHDLVRSYEPVVSALQALKKSLMRDLLTGKVRVGDVAEALAP